MDPNSIGETSESESETDSEEEEEEHFKQPAEKKLRTSATPASTALIPSATNLRPLPKLLAPFVTELRIRGEFLLVLRWPLHSFARFDFYPHPEDALETSRLRVVIRSESPPPDLLSLADQKLQFLEGLEDPHPIEEEYLFQLPKVVNLRKRERKKYRVEDLLEDKTELEHLSIGMSVPPWLTGFEVFILQVFDSNAPKARIGKM